MWLRTAGSSRVLHVLLLLIAAVQAGPSKAKVDEWSVDDVCKWAEGQGFKEISQPLKQHQVDGIVLLHIEESDLEDELNMTSTLQRKKFLLKVDDLKKKFKGKALPDRNFWQYRALNRKHADIATILLNGAPRLAFLFSMDDEDMGPTLQKSGLKWIFPHMMIFLHRDEVMEGLPWLLGYGHLVMGILEPIIIPYSVFLYSTGKSVERAAAVRVFFGQVVVMMYAAFAYWLLYPLIPWVLCDLSFFFSMIWCWWHGFATLAFMFKRDMQDGKIG